MPNNRDVINYEPGETTWSIKIGTVVAIVLAVLSIAIGGMATWTGYISSKVASHGEEIAVLKANTANILSIMSRIESITDDIRKDQQRRERIELGSHSK
jgi:hypothetical protein